MKIGIIGDTHGSQQAIRKAIQLLPPVELILHTGDYAPMPTLKRDSLPVIKVSGNCDSPTSANPDEIFERKVSIFADHGHKYFHHGEIGELAWWAPSGNEYWSMVTLRSYGQVVR